jgi:hypothetical protein
MPLLKKGIPITLFTARGAIRTFGELPTTRENNSWKMTQIPPVFVVKTRLLGSHGK